MSGNDRHTIDGAIIIRDEHLAKIETDQLSELERNGNGNRNVWRTVLGIIAACNDPNDRAGYEEAYEDFAYRLHPHTEGILLKVQNAPATNFRDGELLDQRRSFIASALRCLLLQMQNQDLLHSPEGRTKLAHDLLLQAGALTPMEAITRGERIELARVFVWGGHDLEPHDYDYMTDVAEELGHQGIVTVTGAGPGTMRAGLKGNKAGLAERLIRNAEHFGYSCAEIIAAAEPPNKYVDNLVMFPGTPARIEGFLRSAQGGVIGPGRMGTLEELMFLLGVKMHERNQGIALPAIITAPKESEWFLDAFEEFMDGTAGNDALRHYETVRGDRGKVATDMGASLGYVRQQQTERGKRLLWSDEDMLHIPPAFQEWFETNHETTEQLPLHRDQPVSDLLCALCRMFQSIVRGTIVPGYREQVENGRKPYRFRAEPAIRKAILDLMERMDGIYAQGPRCFVIEESRS